MPENLSQKVEATPIEELKGPQEAIVYKMEFLKTVSQARTDLAGADFLLKTDEAKSFLRGSVGEINAVLARVAEHGRKIAQKHATGEKMETAEFAPLDKIKSDLQAELGELKTETGNFSALENAAKQTEALATEAETKCFSINYDKPESALASANDIRGRLPKNLPSTNATAVYRATVDKLISELNVKLEENIKDLPRFIADVTAGRKRLTEFNSAVAEYGKLVAAYEKTPDDATLALLKQLEEKIDPQKLSDELFKGKIGEGENGLYGVLLSRFWNTEFSGFRDEFDKLKQRLDDKVKEGKNAEAEATLKAVEKTMTDIIEPAIKAYWSMNAEERHDSDQEKTLLSQLLQTKFLLANYSSPEMKEMVGFDTHASLTKMTEAVTTNLARIEKEKTQYLNDISMSKKGLSKYVTFKSPQGEESVDGKANYEFTAEFDKLSDNEKAVIRMRVEEIDKQNSQLVKEQTAKAALEFMRPEERLAALKEMMGAKGAKYFEGLEKIKTEDLDGAVSAFNAFVSQPFTPEETDSPEIKNCVTDAKEKIKMIHGERLKTVESLFADVKELRYARRRMGGNPELHYDEAVEADAINAELMSFREDIAEGRVKDFNERFAQLQEKVREAIKKKDQKETGILKLLDKMRLLSQEKDPQKRKEGFSEFATEARNMQAYHLAMKYLDYALEKDYKEAAKHVDKADVLKKLLEDSEAMAKLNEQAKLQYDMLLSEDPSLKAAGLTLETVRQKMLDRALEEKYKKELRRMMTPESGDLALMDPALANYNNWFPIDDPHWIEVWNYGAEQWDEFQMDCIKFVFESLPSLGIGMAASAAGRIGARAGGKLVAKYLMKQGLKEAEIALIKQGGFTALRASLRSGKALSYGATRLLGAATMEGATMLGLGAMMEYMQTGHVKDFEESPGKIPAHLLQSMATATVFRAVNITQSLRPVQAAMRRGGALGKAVWLGTETIGGAGGVGVDYATAYLEGRDFTGKDAFKSMINNYMMSVGMHALHRGPSESAADRRGREAMSREDKMAIFESQFVADPSKIPPEMRGKPAFIDTNGQIFFAPDAFAEFGVGTTRREGKNLFVVDSLGGPYRGKKVELPAREFLRVLAKEREGRPLTPHEQALLPVARNVRDRMEALKIHEDAHRVSESLNNASDGKVGAELAALFGENPELKKAFDERSSAANRETAGFKSIQEFICEVADGRVKLTDAQRASIEKNIADAANIPEFRFDRIRNIDTKLLTNPKMLREHFMREEAAGRDADSPKVRGQTARPWLDSPEEFFGSLRGRDAVSETAKNILTQYLGVLRMNDAVQIQAFKDANAALIDPKILDGVGRFYQQNIKRFYSEVSTPEGMRQISEMKQNGTLHPIVEMLYQQMRTESRTVYDYLSETKPGGAKKTPAEISADLAKLRAEIERGAIELHPMALKSLVRNRDGVALVREYLLNGKIRNLESLPKEVRERLRNDAAEKVRTRVSKGKDALRRKIVELQDEMIRKEAEGRDTYLEAEKLGRLRNLENAYKNIPISDPAKMEGLLTRLENTPHKPGYESLPSLAEIFHSNIDRMDADMLVNFAHGRVTYDELVVYEAGKPVRRKSIHVEGRTLGLGGFGDVMTTMVFDGTSPEGRKMVLKQSKEPLEASQALRDYDIMDPAVRTEIDNLINSVKKLPSFDYEMYLKAAEVVDTRFADLSGHQRKEIKDLLNRVRIIFAERNNAVMVAEMQSRGEMNDLVKVEYVSENETVFLESLANSEIGNRVADFGEIIEGKVTSLDGRNAITPEKFWGGFTDMLDLLGNLHRQGIIHRDIKPENLAFRPDGSIVIIDLGAMMTRDRFSRVKYNAWTEGMLDPLKNDGRDPKKPPILIPAGETHYYPEAEQFSADYYNPKTARDESVGTLGRDGKPLVAFGHGDVFAMRQMLETAIGLHKQDPTMPRWTTDDQAVKLQDVLDYMKQPNSDAAVASQMIRDIMDID